MAFSEPSFKIYAQNKQFQFFKENEEKDWKNPFCFIQGADTQFGFIAKELENKKIITWEKEIELSVKLVEKINNMKPKPKFFVICGDICDEMPESNPELRLKQEFDFKRIFSKLDKDIPLICICGNHDIGNTPTENSIKMYKSSFGDDYFSFWCGGLLFIALNSQYFFDASKVPKLAEEHEKWIEEKLKEAQNKRVIIFQHIPWFITSSDEEDNYFNINKNLRKKWLDKFKDAKVEAIFCGHCHRNAGGSYEQMREVITTAVGGQLGEDKSGARIVNVFENHIEDVFLIIVILGREGSEDATVRELENLKTLLGEGSGNLRELSISKSQTSFFSDVNGEKSGYKKIKNELDKDGKMIAQVQQKIDLIKDREGQPRSVATTEIKIPSKGIHSFFFKNGKSKENNNGKLRAPTSGNSKANTFSEIEYSPLDMAEYIFWTGDEKSVALTIEEFLDQGLMTRQEAIHFLESIKFNLDLMQTRYKGVEKFDEKVSNKEKFPKQKFFFPDKYVEKSKIFQNSDITLEKAESDLHNEQNQNLKFLPYDFELTRQEGYGSLSSGSTTKQEQSTGIKNSKAEEKIKEKQQFIKKKNGKEFQGKYTKNYFSDISEDSYDEAVEKLRIAEFLYKEYSLEEVIYQLAKVMYTQSLNSKNNEAEKVLQRLTTFLQNEVNQKQISKNLEKKILDILLTALSDTLSEHPELMTAMKESSLKSLI